MQLVRSLDRSGGLPAWPIDGDRVGVTASVLCAVHCAVTPVLLIFLPVFGKVWAHPASHWLMALLVVPLAALTVGAGYRKHRRKWVLGCAMLGILFVLAGAMAPSFEKGSAGVPAAASASSTSASVAGPDADSGTCSDSDCSTTCGESNDSAEVPAASCVDACCPSIQAGENGEWRLHVPLASILTTIGGLFLITTHIGNLCRCKCCREEAASA